MYLNLLLNVDIVLLTILLTLSIEAVTVAGRFVLGVEVISDTPPRLRNLTLGLRLHHSYLGAGGVFTALTISPLFPGIAMWVTVAGVALLASDLLHHFCILWPLTGHHEFFLSYPE